jgi:ribosomal protein S12 methylthiotransferase
LGPSTGRPPAAGTLGRVAFYILGCAKNQVEAESMSSRLAQQGWELTADLPNASVVVVHTCGFLSAARDEALDTVRQVRKAAPRSFLVMSGCFAQYLGGKTPKGVDALLGTGEFGRLPELLSGVAGEKARPGPGGYHDGFRPRPLRPGQLSAYLRISEGCNHRCTFCVIPQLRGNLVSRPVEDVLLEGRNLVDRGVRELTIISQDTSDYGRDLSPRAGLTDLLKPMLEWDDLPWLRLLYVYPSEVGDGLIDMLAGEEKLCGYLDMPLQHISDRVLTDMKRDWGRKKTLALLERLRRRVPGLALRTTFIVGFPGETEKDFRELLDVVEDGYFEHVGVFPYSLEKRSPSAQFGGQVSPEAAQERWQRLVEAQGRVFAANVQARAGKDIQVMVERDPRGRWTARARHQAPEVDGGVTFKACPEKAGFYRARVTGGEGADLTAVAV